GHDLARDVAASAIDGGDGAVGVVFGFIEGRSVGPGGRAGDLGEDLLAGGGGAFTPPDPLEIGGGVAFFEGHPAVHEPGETFLAVADDEEVDEGGEDLGILGAGAAGDN